MKALFLALQYLWLQFIIYGNSRNRAKKTGEKMQTVAVVVYQPKRFQLSCSKLSISSDLLQQFFAQLV
jgi:hypothetical protein